MSTFYPLNTLMRRVMGIRATGLVAVLTALVVLASVFFFRDARTAIDRQFPGFLTFKNNMVGAYSGFDWPGYKKGLRYHDLIFSELDENRYVVQRGDDYREVKVLPASFSLKDFLLVFFAPFASGIFYILCAIIIFAVARNVRGIVPFVLFNLGIAYYLIASFDFHYGHHLPWLFMLNFVLIPAYMSHFAMVFPHEASWVRGRNWCKVVPYLFSILIYAPYVYSFYRAPAWWTGWELAVVGYAVLSYVFWIGMLVRSSKYAARQTDRTAASYLLLGQLLAFVIPLTAAVAVFVFNRNIPLNVIAPVIIALPVASLFGIVLGNLRNAQLKLVQAEKMASLGNLVAGVAHEINNPTTFIYSNIAALREYVTYIREAVNQDAGKFKGELTAQEVIDDLDSLVGTVAEGADRIKSIVADLRRFGHSQDDIVIPVNVGEGIQGTLNLLHHEIADRVKVQLDVPEGLFLEANPGQINQLWMNILANAAYAIKGEGRIWISGSKDANGINIQIRDDGKGMSKEVLNQAFDPFFTTKPEGQGTGMGLAICQQIVHRWGGQIEVHSEKGKGTTVRVSFPGA
jgi:signal transduction histidine kinase